MIHTHSLTARLALAAALLAAPATIGARQQPTATQPASGSDPQFKVRLDFNRWHDVAELKSDFDKLARAWPKLLKMSSLGKSHGGRDIILMTINNPDTGLEMGKPAMYIEANVHGNEIQGSEVSLYTVWYLMENYGRIDQITKLVNERVFYVVPTVNPDGRDHFLKGSGGGARTGHVPLDDDNDGRADEDGDDDLNANGVIEQIRKHVPGQGNLRKNAQDPRILEPAPAGQMGDYVILGSEGIDNDDDGRVNEDPVGGYDGNRNWAPNWQPNYIQGGAMDYPFQLPEARAVNDFLMAHPNIAGVQSYHNNGGMILRGPGAEWQGEYPRADVAVYDELGRQGERMLPYYKYMVIWSGLYTVHGGFIDWTNDGLGMLSFSNELWNGNQYFNSPDLQTQQRDPNSPVNPRVAQYFFDDFLEFGGEYVEWKAFDHPQFGPVEMGGWKKTVGRVPPRFMNEELSHRNMAFSLYQADQMPQMKGGETKAEAIGGGVYRVRVDFTNAKLTPTIMAKAAENNVVRPDLLTAEGRGMEVLSAGWVPNKFRPGATELIDQRDLTRILLRTGQAGRTTRTIEYLVRGTGDLTVTYDSVKGGKAVVKVAVK
ncbi:MAG TPA: M14 family metallopeptidase [Vicinamibacterales bacterium]|nr:M14 family metallopeptidase [Vicinamibacterales bacterium]